MKLTAAQTKAMPLLVSGLQQKDIAEKVGVTPQTISTWMKDAEFVAYLNQARSDALDGARDMLRGLANEAVEELRSIILNSENDEVRRKAIIDVLDMIGIKNPSMGCYGWGIGPKYADQVEKKWEQEANPELFKLLGMSF
ncbi:MAG: phBC6A51 family helix-turn-helix protein [Hyphomicrobiales bacterium]